MTELHGVDLIAGRMSEASVTEVDVQVRQFEGERIYLVSVPKEQVPAASELARTLEDELSSESQAIVVTVRASRVAASMNAGPLQGLADPRVNTLVQLLTSRSRTSEGQPSLAYIPNNTSNLAAVTGARHHLIFGRRGAGKTALLLEAKRVLETDGQVTAWVNAQPYRSEGIERAFLRIAAALCDQLIVTAQARDLTAPAFFEQLIQMRDRIRDLLDAPSTSSTTVRRLVPDLQIVVKRTTSTMGDSVYLFIDDFYYLPRFQQADILELIHSSTRDANVWLKVASIRHLSRWFRPNPPTGLQTGQDAALIDLDLSLQDTKATAHFLTEVLRAYCGHAGIGNLNSLMTTQAVDRLVFASGGVPRDFLTLAASSIARGRSKMGARQVGVSAVNQAAGDAARTKIGELEDDLASNIGYAAQTHQALTRVREFCLDEKNFTYFRVDFRDKERNQDEYGVLTRLLEVRLIHLIDQSVSDGAKAGERSECYSLDLSQYSSYRLKQGIRVLDLEHGLLVSKQTRIVGKQAMAMGGGGRKIVGATAREVVQILRGAPLLDLARFRDLVQLFTPLVEELEKALRGRPSSTIDEIVLRVKRPYQEVADALTEFIEQGRAIAVDADGRAAFQLVSR